MFLTVLEIIQVAPNVNVRECLPDEQAAPCVVASAIVCEWREWCL